ncbi:hypothetical protein FSARC_14728 [Fusarium sarcochroum]|uniref:Knr4/Smi1-like domain-containing protein n=1 Tax=Fusarium sarcochroum TaxID=1208366 RepID=A0A8H4SRA7_9HYPO|nr:hypothetical protein FSARC_14728 [Fusarium sarcochroum]
MGPYKKFDRFNILINPSLQEVYHHLITLAEEFAVLGHMSAAKTLISLLLSQDASQDHHREIQYLKYAFAESNIWPDEITLESRREEELEGIVMLEPGVSPSDSGSEMGDTDYARFHDLLYTDENCDGMDGRPAMTRSAALADALAIAIDMASEDNPDIQEIEKDKKVQKVLDRISRRMHSHHAAKCLTERRINWSLLATGALARKIPVDLAKLDAFSEEVIATFKNRFEKGRQLHEGSIKELLIELDRNTRNNSDASQYQMEPVPETLFSAPATDEQILAVERKLDIQLPDDYREYLKISNGFGGEGLWNGYHLVAPLFGTDDLEWEEGFDIPIELHESVTAGWDLSFPDDLEWPSYEKELLLFGRSDIFAVYFIPPDLTKKVLEAYSEAFSSSDISNDLKQQIHKSIASQYGSWDEFQKLEWVAVSMDEGWPTAHGTFTQFLQDKVRESSRADSEGEAVSRWGSIAYSCMPDSS